MKRLISVSLCLALIMSLAACGGKSDNTQSNLVESIPQTEKAEDNAAASKILVVYFSSANTSGADVISYATPYFGSVSSTEYLANYIHTKLGGDIAKISVVNDYPTDYSGTANTAKKERDDDARPKFQPLETNPEDYDIIFVGYPVWWYTLPMVMYSFFDEYDFSDKTIIPFNTHEGSGDGGTYATIAELEPAATVIEGFNVRGRKADAADSDLDEWIGNLNIK